MEDDSEIDHDSLIDPPKAVRPDARRGGRPPRGKKKPDPVAKPPKRLDVREKRGRPAQPIPWAGNAKAREIAAQAAEAVGMTPADLADLLMDNGIGATMPDAANVTTYTLEDLGMRLWASLQQHHRSKRAKWFSELSNVQKNSVITVLRDRGFHFEVIAREFGIETKDVVKAWNSHCDKLGDQVIGTRLPAVIGQLQSHASRAQQMAMENGDHRSFWKISSEYVGMLQSLGAIERAPVKFEHEVTHKIEDRQSEIDALMLLEQKKRLRVEELKRVEATVTASDPLPPMALDVDEEQEIP